MFKVNNKETRTTAGFTILLNIYDEMFLQNYQLAGLIC